MSVLKILTISNVRNGAKCGNSLTSFTFPNYSDFHAENASGTVSLDETFRGAIRLLMPPFDRRAHLVRCDPFGLFAGLPAVVFDHGRAFLELLTHGHPV